MIEIKDKAGCCGCGACDNACPAGSISMVPDREGFLYPNVDKRKCINCNICVGVCPMLEVTEEKREQSAYLVQIKDEAVRRESTSGGAFTAIARHIVRGGGVVFGAAFDDGFEVIHKYVEKEEELEAFRNSKYVQSKIKDTFLQAWDFLNSGRTVCFSGTPCQIEGLKKFLRREYPNLLTVDVVCRAVPSPLLFQRYLQMQRDRRNVAFEKVIFRNKYYGYKYSTMSFIGGSDESLSEYHEGVDSDVYLRAFFSNICDRPSCYSCKFKKLYRVSDFTIWDCFNVEDYDRKMDDDKGTTKVLAHTKKAEKLLKAISNDINYLKIDVPAAVKDVHELLHSVCANPKREAFFADLNRLTIEELFKKYFPDSIRVKCERMARRACYKLGIYNVAKKAVKKIVQR